MHLNLIPRSFDTIWYTCLQQNVATRFCRQARVSKTWFVGSEKFSASLRERVRARDMKTKTESQTEAEARTGHTREHPCGLPHPVVLVDHN